MDRETALLASLPPSAWNETLRRMEVIRSFRDIAAPNGQDIRDHAAALRLNARSVYRLIRAHENLSAGVMPTGSRRGSKRSLRQSADGEIDIQAYLARDGLRCLIRIGRSIFYHHPLQVINAYGMRPPEIRAGEHVPLACILQHELLDPVPITVTSWVHLNSFKSQLGIRVHVAMPTISVSLKRDNM